MAIKDFNKDIDEILTAYAKASKSDFKVDFATQYSQAKQYSDAQRYQFDYGRARKDSRKEEIIVQTNAYDMSVLIRFGDKQIKLTDYEWYRNKQLQYIAKFGTVKQFAYLVMQLYGGDDELQSNTKSKPKLPPKLTLEEWAEMYVNKRGQYRWLEVAINNAGSGSRALVILLRDHSFPGGCKEGYHIAVAKLVSDSHYKDGGWRKIVAAQIKAMRKAARKRLYAWMDAN